MRTSTFLTLLSLALIACTVDGPSEAPESVDTSSDDDEGAVTPTDQRPAEQVDAPSPRASALDAGMSPRNAGSSSRDAGVSSPDAGTARRTDAGASTEPPSATRRPRCVNKPSQVMIVGDSYINWITHTFPTDLATASGQKGWRLEAIGAASMGSGGATTRIPKQFDDSLARDPDVHTVVMDGGGNDVLVPAPSIDPNTKCKNDPSSPSLPECQRIIEVALKAGSDLMDRAAAAGVRDVVFFFYPTVPEGTLVGGAKPNAINTYALPKVRALCEDAAERTGGKLRCHFVDMVPVFEGHDEWFFFADIHPNSKGSRAMADAVWATMKKQCIGQLPSSGCCE